MITAMSSPNRAAHGVRRRRGLKPPPHYVFMRGGAGMLVVKVEFEYPIDVWGLGDALLGAAEEGKLGPQVEVIYAPRDMHVCMFDTCIYVWNDEVGIQHRYGWIEIGRHYLAYYGEIEGLQGEGYALTLMERDEGLWATLKITLPNGSVERGGMIDRIYASPYEVRDLAKACGLPIEAVEAVWRE